MSTINIFNDSSCMQETEKALLTGSYHAVNLFPQTPQIFGTYACHVFRSDPGIKPAISHVAFSTASFHQALNHTTQTGPFYFSKWYFVGLYDEYLVKSILQSTVLRSSHQFSLPYCKTLSTKEYSTLQKTMEDR